MSTETDLPPRKTIASTFLPPLEWQEGAFGQTYSSQIQFLIEGLKVLALAQGGAVVAVLSLYGALVANCTSTPKLAEPIAHFSSGLLYCVLGFLVGYFAQMFFLKWVTNEKMFDLRMHLVSFWVGVLVVGWSVNHFVKGANSATGEFQVYKCERSAALKPANTQMIEPKRPSPSLADSVQPGGANP